MTYTNIPAVIEKGMEQLKQEIAELSGLSSYGHVLRVTRSSLGENSDIPHSVARTSDLNASK
eukprot:4380413-Pyramimonas_sp.AAC.1